MILDHLRLRDVHAGLKVEWEVMSNILFLSQRIPYPPNKGEKIRAFHFLKHLARHHQVYLGCFVDDPEDLAHVDALESLCAEIHAVPLTKAAGLTRALWGLSRNRPITCAYYDSRELLSWVQGVLSTRHPDFAFVYSASMAQYLDKVQDTPETVLMDFVDVDSDKWRQYAERKSWPMSMVYAREARRLLSHDRAVTARVSACTFVSEPEAQLFRSQVPDFESKIHALPNGVDVDYFAPGEFARPFTDQGPHFVFTGTMDYWPNVDAVVWFAQEVLPKVRRERPNAQFHIVGANPVAPVESLGTGGAIHVTGRVEDVRPYIAHADVIVAPMRVARGVQNKVLEGMAMAKPVVTTPQGIEGIPADSGRHYIQSDSADDFAQACLQATQHTIAVSLGAEARKFILEHFTWDASLSKLDQLLFQGRPSR